MCWGDWSRQFSLVFFGCLFVLFSSVTLVIWTLLLNFSSRPKKKCQGSVWQGAQLSTITPLHDIDMIIATRGERIKNSGAFHWHDHPSYPVKYNSMRNYFNVSQVNFRTKGWEIASHEEARRSEQPILYVRQTQLHSFRLPVNVSALHYFHVKPFP